MFHDVDPPHSFLRSASPAILYLGTPVVLVGTCNEDQSSNLAPISSAWWLGWRCMLGLARGSKTTQNLLRSGECVINLPSADMVAHVDRIARTTGSDPVPAGKQQRGYRFEKNKFEAAGLTAAPGETVAAPRALECPIQLEAKLVGLHAMGEDDDQLRGILGAIEVRVTRVHLDGRIMVEGAENRIDPDKWRPLIMSFQEYYGLAPGKLHRSELAQIPEDAYRGLAR